MNQKKFLAGFLGATMIFTQNPSIALDNSASSHPTVNKNHSGEGLSTAVKIALGVGIPTVAIAAIIGGALIYLHNKDQRIEPLDDNDVQLDDNSSDQNVPVIASSQPGSSNTVPQVSVVPPQTNQPTSAQPPVVLPSGAGKILQALHANEVSPTSKTNLPSKLGSKIGSPTTVVPPQVSTPGSSANAVPPQVSTLGSPAKVVSTPGSSANAVPPQVSTLGSPAKVVSTPGLSAAGVPPQVPTPVPPVKVVVSKPAPRPIGHDGSSSVRTDKSTPQKPAKPVAIAEPELGAIGDARAKYERANPGKATKLEDFDHYNGTKGSGESVDNFEDMLFWAQCLAHPSKGEQMPGHIIEAQPVDSFRDGLLNVDDIVLDDGQIVEGRRSKELRGLKDLSELNKRIFVQVGKTPQENISYTELHRLLWAHACGKPDLHNFWKEHQDHIDERFMALLKKYGYNLETAPVASSVLGSVDVPPPYVPTSPMITKHSAASAGSKDLFEGILPQNIYVRGFHHLTDAEINTPTKYMVKDEKTEKVYGGFGEPYRETTLDNGQCATNQTGYGHGIANIFACFADRLNRRMVLAYDELRDQEFYTVSDTIPEQTVVSGRSGSIEHMDCANMATALLRLQKKGCKNISCNSAPNPSDPSGSPAGALTLEETISGESTYFVTVGSGVAKPYYQIFAKNKVFDPRALGIARNITFYTPDLLSNGYMLRQGLNPSTLNMDPKEVYEKHTIKNVTVLLSAAPKKDRISGADFRAMNLQQINALRAMGCDGVVIVEGGAGSFESIPSEYYQPGGMIEQIWREKAPDMHVVIMHTPRSQFSRGLNSAYSYLEESEKAVESSALAQDRKTALLATIERARRDVTLDADPLKRAMQGAVRGGSIPDSVTLENGKVEIDTTAIAKHVVKDSKNIAACYYGKTAIHNFIEDVLASRVIEDRSEKTLAKKLEAAHGENKTIMSTLLWRNSNNTIWYVTGKKAGFRFSEPTYTGMWPKDDCVLKRFVEYNGKMYAAKLVYDGTANGRCVELKDENDEVKHYVREGKFNPFEKEKMTLEIYSSKNRAWNIQSYYYQGDPTKPEYRKWSDIPPCPGIAPGFVGDALPTVFPFIPPTAGISTGAGPTASPFGPSAPRTGNGVTMMNIPPFSPPGMVDGDGYPGPGAGADSASSPTVFTTVAQVPQPGIPAQQSTDISQNDF